MRKVIAALVVVALFAVGCGSNTSSGSSSESLPIGPHVCTDWSQIDIGATAAKVETNAAVRFDGHGDAPADARTSPYRAVIKFKLAEQASNGVGFVTGDGQVRASFFVEPTSLKPDADGYVTLTMGVGVGPLKVLGLAKTSKGVVSNDTDKVIEYKIGDQPATNTYRQTPSC